MKRFIRTERLFGQEALKKLTAARVTVVGLGAVGSFAVEALARTGVGHLFLVDTDDIQESNINRQLFALDSTLGRPKVEVARARVLEINPACRVETLKALVNRDSMSRVFEQPADVLIDAIDSVGPKVALLHAALQANLKAVISSMGAAEKTDPFKVHVGDISKTHNCNLARFIRKRLKRVGVSKGITCVYSTELARRDHAPDAEHEPVSQGRPRMVMGSWICITGLFGLIAAREAVRKILE